MKGYIPACLLALAALALGQGLGDLPDCAKACAANLPKECNLADIKCYCSSSSWIQTLSCCVKNACVDTDQAKTIQVASSLCQLAGVTVPTVASCAGSATASSTAAASSSSSASKSSVTGEKTATSASTATQISSSSASAAASATGTSSRSATSATHSATTASSAAAASTSPSSAAAAGHFFGQGLGAAGAAAFAFVLL